MSKFEFIKFEPTPTEKHFGIATVKLFDKVIAKFKMINTKDGSAFFPAAPSLKLGESYVSAFMLDSQSEKEELDNLIKHNVRQALNGGAQKAPPQQQQYQQTSFTEECPF